LSLLVAGELVAAVARSRVGATEVAAVLAVIELQQVCL
jgi:hypothetical protein